MCIRSVSMNFYKNFNSLTKPNFFTPMRISSAQIAKVIAGQQSQSAAYENPKNAIAERLRIEGGGKERSEEGRHSKIVGFVCISLAAEFEYQTKIKPLLSKSDAQSTDSGKTIAGPSLVEEKTEAPVIAEEKKTEAAEADPIDKPVFEEILPPNTNNESAEVDLKDTFNSCIGDVRESQNEQQKENILFSSSVQEEIEVSQQVEEAPISIDPLPESNQPALLLDGENKVIPEETDSPKEDNESNSVAVCCSRAASEPKGSTKQAPAAIFIAALLLSAAVLFCVAKDKK